MKPDWFKPRRYKHFDVPVGDEFISKVSDPQFVQKNSWLPHIHYIKRVKRYKRKLSKTEYKDRDIMYASHRDACILTKYAYDLGLALEKCYAENRLGENVIAYRKLGKANYHFSADAYLFCLANAPCRVLCYDITGFFDHLNHSILKGQLKKILKCSELAEELTEDWYKVFRHVTRFKTVKLKDISDHKVFGERLKLKNNDPIATISEIKAAGIAISANSKRYGIPQGTPISSVLSNVYMIDLDKRMVEICNRYGALYQRYSDDIIIVCRAAVEKVIDEEFLSTVHSYKLCIKEEKTERKNFDPGDIEFFQYLGFNVSPDGALIRSSSLSRQWRKAKRSLARVRLAGELAILEGRATKIYTKNLRKQLSPIGIRNFSLYARHSAKAFGSPRIVKQALRLKRMADEAIRDLNKRKF